MPPLHPNCCSTIVPDDEDMDRADERDIEFVRNYDKIGLEERFDYVMNGEELFIPKGAEITNVKVIAGKGSGTELRVKHKLVNQYGGNPNDWQKAVGKIESAKYMFDMHWYRKNDTEQTEIKLKIRRDQK